MIWYALLCFNVVKIYLHQYCYKSLFRNESLTESLIAQLILQEDLDPGDYGDVWVKPLSSDSIIISYESVAFFSNTGTVNVQATLSSDGSVSICFGVGDNVNNALASGIEGGENDELFPNGPAVVSPLPGFPFDSDGISFEWPSDRCYCFDPDTYVWEAPSNDDDDDVPSETPSESPSETPSESPSTDIALMH